MTMMMIMMSNEQMNVPARGYDEIKMATCARELYTIAYELSRYAHLIEGLENCCLSLKAQTSTDRRRAFELNDTLSQSHMPCAYLITWVQREGRPAFVCVFRLLLSPSSIVCISTFQPCYQMGIVSRFNVAFIPQHKR